MEELAGLLVIGIGLYLLNLFSDNTVQRAEECIKNAAKGKPVDVHELATAYWNKHTSTYYSKSEWLGMNRNDKAAALKQREDLERQFAEFDVSIQAKVMSVRARDAGAPRSSRTDAIMSKILKEKGGPIGIILSVGNEYGFIRPHRSETSYYFNSTDVVNGFYGLADGDIVHMVLAENSNRLCAKSVRKHIT